VSDYAADETWWLGDHTDFGQNVRFLRTSFFSAKVENRFSLSGGRYQSGPDGLLRTLNSCPCFGEEHAEQFGAMCTAPQQPSGLTRNPGGNYFDTLEPSRLRRHLVKRLESLGYEVTLAERNAA